MTDKQTGRIDEKVKRGTLDIIAEVLQVQEVDVGDSLLDLGSDSLHASMIVVELNSRFNVRLDLAAVLQCDDIESLCRMICKSMVSDDFQGAEHELRNENESDELTEFTASAQEARMYAMWGRDPESTAYNISQPVMLETPINVEDLNCSLNDLLKVEPILRSQYFVDTSGTLKRKVAPYKKMEIEVINAGDDLEKAMRKSIKPFNLASGPLMRLSIVYTDAGKQILIFDFHHIVMDGTSLVTVLSSFFGGRPSAFRKQNAAQYSLYEEWQQRFQTGKECRKDKEFWESYLYEANRGYVPVFPSRGETDHKIEIVERTIPAGIVSAPQYTKTEILLSIYALTLCRLTGKQRIHLGIPVSGRTRAEFAKSIGLFVNTLPIDIKCDLGQTPAQLVKQTAEGLRSCISHQDFQIDWMNSFVNSREGEGLSFGATSFDCMFTMENMAIEQISQQTRERIRLLPTLYTNSKSPLNLVITQNTNDFNLRFLYDPDLLRGDFIQRIADRMTDYATNQHFLDTAPSLAKQKTRIQNKLNF